MEPELDLRGTRHCASFVARRTARAITNLYELALEPTGLRSTGFTILVAIAKTEPVAIGALARTLGLDSTTMTRNLRLLQERALISISARSSDRQRLVTLLPQGRNALKRCLPHWRKMQKQFLMKIGPDSWAALQRALEQLALIATELRDPKEKIES